MIIRNSKQIIVIFVSAVFLLMFVIGCSQNADTNTAQPQSSDTANHDNSSEENNKVTLRIALTTEKGGLGDLQTQIFKDEVEKALPGYFDIQIFPGSQLGTGKENIQSLTTGDLEAAFLGSEGLSIDPKLNIFEIPWLFNGFDEFRKGTSGQLFDEVSKTFNDHSMAMVAIYGSGFRDILTKKPANNLGDLKGMKIRLAASPERLKLYNLLGAVPVTIEWADTYLALQQGTVDGVEAFPVFLRSGKMYEQAKYLADVNYVSAPAFVTFSGKFWNGLPQNVKDGIIQAGKNSMDKANDLAVELEQNDMDFMKQQGVEIVSTDLSGYQELRNKISEDYVKQFGDDWLRKAGVN